jgi:membrane-associated phospholipid phosphatase
LANSVLTRPVEPVIKQRTVAAPPKKNTAWVWLLLACTLCASLFAANCNPYLHHLVLGLDRTSAYEFNSFVGHSQVFDLTLADLSTKFGDLFVLLCVATVIAVHSLRGTTLKESARRISFWIYASMWCVGSYLFVCCWLAEDFTPRETPITALPIKNVQEMYHIKLRTSAIHSYPSGHALAYTLFCITSLKTYPGMAVFFGTLGVVMLWVRLTLGLHWISDMVFGSLPLALLVLAVAAQPLSQKLYQLLERVVTYTITVLAKGGCPILADKLQD